MHKKGENIYQYLNDFFTEYSIPSKKCARICTDGAAACTGFKPRFVGRVKDKNQMINGHFVFSSERLLPQKKLHKVLNSVVKSVNLIKARPLNQNIFSCLCADMQNIEHCFCIQKYGGSHGVVC